ncbi:MAG: hypothetical protein DSM106950_26740 [Stigonema ocellatum SAG 48.90 = DSM 106950]|nr:hypothetical protein [Stigonema ocellatum SAG 48.90 = DSM 106950]
MGNPIDLGVSEKGAILAPSGSGLSWKLFPPGPPNGLIRRRLPMLSSNVTILSITPSHYQSGDRTSSIQPTRLVIAPDLLASGFS